MGGGGYSPSHHLLNGGVLSDGGPSAVDAEARPALAVAGCRLRQGGSADDTDAEHKRTQRKLLIALCLALVFMLVELVGGLWAHSLAVITDAAHLLSDVSGFGVAVLAAFWAKRRSSAAFTYGYHRVEVLGALVSVGTVWLVTGILLVEAVQRIIEPEPVDGKVMFWVALAGVGVNVLMLLVLGENHFHGLSKCSHGHGAACSHGHAHGYGACGHDHTHDDGACSHDHHTHGDGAGSHDHGHGKCSHSHAHSKAGHGDSRGKCSHSHSPALSDGAGCATDLEAGHKEHLHLHHHSSDEQGEGWHVGAAGCSTGGCAPSQGHAHTSSHDHSNGNGQSHGHHGHGHQHHGHHHKQQEQQQQQQQAGTGLALASSSAAHSHSPTACCTKRHPHHLQHGAGSAADKDSGCHSDDECTGHTPILHAVTACCHRGGGGDGTSDGHSCGMRPVAALAVCHSSSSSASLEAGSHGHGHNHGRCHGHSHGNLNLRGAVVHAIGDLVQSIGVAVAGALIWAHQGDPRWYIADPACTFLFAGLVLWTTRAILRDISDVLMERVPRGRCAETIQKEMLQVPGVEAVHDLHVWSLTPSIPLLCAHVRPASQADVAAVQLALTEYCRGIGIEHSTIQVDHVTGCSSAQHCEH